MARHEQHLVRATVTELLAVARGERADRWLRDALVTSPRTTGLEHLIRPG
jgi:hypothetical protein